MKTDTNTADAPPSDANEATTVMPAITADWPARFQLRHPKPGWEGNVSGQKFVGGVAYTDSSLIAHGLMSLGVLPTDRDTGRPAFGLDGDVEAQGRLAEHAKRAWGV